MKLTSAIVHVSAVTPAARTAAAGTLQRYCRAVAIVASKLDPRALRRQLNAPTAAPECEPGSHTLPRATPRAARKEAVAVA